jgi:RNA polymerase sigma factor (sigma-70 family)
VIDEMGRAAARALDATTARRIAAREVTALHEVYERHAGGLSRLAIRLTGDRATAEEVVQDVYVRLWSRPDTYSADRGSLGAWMFMMCHSASVDAVRKRARQIRRDGTHAADVSGPARVFAEGSGLAADCPYDDADLRAAVAALPTPQRLAVELAYFEGLTYRATAERLGIPEGTAKSQLRAALLTLRRSLTAELVA